jgi:hypothetical protein
VTRYGRPGARRDRWCHDDPRHRFLSRRDGRRVALSHRTINASTRTSASSIDTFRPHLRTTRAGRWRRAVECRTFPSSGCSRAVRPGATWDCVVRRSAMRRTSARRSSFEFLDMGSVSRALPESEPVGRSKWTHTTVFCLGSLIAELALCDKPSKTSV